MKSLVLAVAWVAWAGQVAGLVADPLDQWQWRNPLPNGNALNAITYADGQFVAVGAGGAVATSLDGLTWEAELIGPVYGASTYYTLNGIACGNGAFVAVGYTMTGTSVTGEAIVISRDGVTWGTAVFPDSTRQLEAVTYGGGQFVAVGDGGTVLTSPDGTNWTAQLSMTTDWLVAVAYGNDTYVALGMGGTLVSSKDGTNWTEQTLSAWSSFSGLAYGNGTFVAVAGGGASFVCTSTNGYDWISLGFAASPGPLLGVGWDAGMFVALGGGGLVASSTDGANWTKHASGSLQGDLRAVAHGNGAWVVLGNSVPLVSTNLSTWHSLESSVAGYLLSSVAYGNGLFVGGSAVDAGLVVSPDGVQWTAEGSGTPSPMQSVTYGNGLFVAAGNQGAIATSANGVNWLRPASGVTSQLRGTAYDRGQFVVVGDGGVVLASTNGVDWERRDPGYGGSIYSVASGNGTFVAGADAGVVLTSGDGVQWTAQDSGAVNALQGIAYGSGRFVAVGTGTIQTSPDAGTWTPANTATGADLLAVCFGHGTFVAVGRAGTILTSTNGLDWISRPSGTMNYLPAVAYGKGTFVVVGEGGTILQSAQLAGTLLKLGPVTPVTSGAKAVTVNGVLGDTWEIQASTNLLDWLPMTNVTITNVPMQFLDQGATSFNRRFYRGFSPN